jgi:hypothetical protein
MQTEHNSKSELHKFLESLTSIWSVNYWLLWFFNYLLRIKVTVKFFNHDADPVVRKYRLTKIYIDDGVLFILLNPIKISFNKGCTPLIESMESRKKMDNIPTFCFLLTYYSIDKPAK